MRCIYRKKFTNKIETVHYFNPGEYLSDSDLMAMYRQLLAINAGRSTPIKHKLVNAETPLDEIRAIYRKMIVGILMQAGEAVGFLISPLLENGNIKIVHAGLVVISRNHGSNLLGLLSLGLVRLAYRRLGEAYITNISSTPSIIESFAQFTAKPWPDPDAKLVKPPRAYRKVFHTLMQDYVLRYFPDAEQVIADSKRFVIRSSSKEMGFNTSLREISRSSHFKYMNFCFVWLDYEREEDLVQVARLSRLNNLKLILKLFLTKRLLKAQSEAAAPTPEGQPTSHPVASAALPRKGGLLGGRT